jgi:hypothetical protein
MHSRSHLHLQRQQKMLVFGLVEYLDSDGRVWWRLPERPGKLGGQQQESAT